jgi:hypothetical protein
MFFLLCVITFSSGFLLGALVGNGFITAAQNRRERRQGEVQRNLTLRDRALQERERHLREDELDI